MMRALILLVLIGCAFGQNPGDLSAAEMLSNLSSTSSGTGLAAILGSSSTGMASSSTGTLAPIAEHLAPILSFGSNPSVPSLVSVKNEVLPPTSATGVPEMLPPVPRAIYQPWGRVNLGEILGLGPEPLPVIIEEPAASSTGAAVTELPSTLAQIGDFLIGRERERLQRPSAINRLVDVLAERQSTRGTHPGHVIRRQLLETMTGGNTQDIALSGDNDQSLDHNLDHHNQRSARLEMPDGTLAEMESETTDRKTVRARSSIANEAEDYGHTSRRLFPRFALSGARGATRQMRNSFRDFVRSALATYPEMAADARGTAISFMSDQEMYRALNQVAQQQQQDEPQDQSGEIKVDVNLMLNALFRSLGYAGNEENAQSGNYENPQSGNEENTQSEAEEPANESSSDDQPAEEDFSDDQNDSDEYNDNSEQTVPDDNEANQNAPDPESDEDQGMYDDSDDSRDARDESDMKADEQRLLAWARQLRSQAQTVGSRVADRARHAASSVRSAVRQHLH